ncbi:MAG: cytochrome c oxidase subunit II [Gemmatimonadales bacterium]|nr:MAG: cytochrome c oxidase subunit II [Gemmatimonadales bacterium]
MRLTRSTAAPPPLAGGNRSLRGSICTAILLALLLVLAGCGAEYPQSTINPHSDFAEIIHSLYVSIFWWTMLILAVVWVLLTYVVVKYRRKSEDEQPRQIRGHLGLEIGWTVGPALIVIAIAIPSIQAVFATQRPVSEDAMEVHVTGHQFWWEFHYPEQGITTANELWLPVDQPVNLRLHSNDVIHSFWVPKLGGKRDANPVPAVREGQDPKYNWLYFTPLQTGVFMGQCAEFCGQSHALMAMRVVVDTEEGFQDWVDRWFRSEGADFPTEAADFPSEGADSPSQALAEVAEYAAEYGNGAGDLDGSGVPVVATGNEVLPVQAASTHDDDPLVARGREVFLGSTCIACHAVQGTSAQGVIGPNLTLFGARHTLGAGIMENNRENLIRWIKDPMGMKAAVAMPGVDYPGGNWPATGLSDDEVEAIAVYLLSLK